MATPYDQHGGSHTGLPSIYPPKTPSVTLVTVLDNTDIHQLLPRIRWDLVQAWHIVVRENLSIYHPRLKQVKLANTSPSSLLEYVQSLSHNENNAWVQFGMADVFPWRPEHWRWLELQEARNARPVDLGNDQILYPVWDIYSEKDAIPVPFPLSSNFLDIPKQLLRKIQRISWTSSEAYTPLCHHASKYITDKSPHHIGTLHRHSYTSLYHHLLGARSKNDLTFVEIGILYGNSLRMWRDYFTPQSKVCGFDFKQQLVDNAKKIPGVQVAVMDVTSTESILNAYIDMGQTYDIIVDDSTHTVRDEARIIRESWSFLKKGGIMIVEDIFRQVNLASFYDILAPLMDEIDSVWLFDTNHQHQNSGNWNNDAVLVINKN